MRGSATPKALLVFLATILPASAGAEPMRFAWPVPAKVKVTDRSVREGTEVVVRYDVSLGPAPDGKRLALRMSGFEFLEINGRDARTPAIRKQLRGALKELSASPTLIIARDGAFEEIAGMDKLIEQAIASLPAANRAQARKAHSAQFTAALQEASAQFWNVWVGMWIGTDLPEGRSRETEQAIALSDGSTLKRPLSITNHGPAGPPDHVQLTFDSTMKEDRNGKLRGLINGMIQSGRTPGRPAPSDQVQVHEVSTSGGVITDPATLQPSAARWQKRITVQAKGEPPQVSVESHDYTFTWGKPAARKR